MDLPSTTATDTQWLVVRLFALEEDCALDWDGTFFRERSLWHPPVQARVPIINAASDEGDICDRADFCYSVFDFASWKPLKI